MASLLAGVAHQRVIYFCYTKGSLCDCPGDDLCFGDIHSGLLRRWSSMFYLKGNLYFEGGNLEDGIAWDKQIWNVFRATVGDV